MTRSRTCEGIGNCDGNQSETRNCGTVQCANWEEWNDFGTCSTSCGSGLRERNRICSGFGECFGSAVEVDQCSYGDCAEWSE